MTSPVKIDLDDLESKARAADTGEIWRQEPADPLAVPFGVETDGGTGEVACVAVATTAAHAQHIAANAPPVTLALIARISELEAALRAAVGGLGMNPPTSEAEARSDAELSDRCHEILEKGVVLT